MRSATVLTGAAVTLRMRKNHGTTVIALACTIDSPATGGIARHVRTGADGIVAGTYDVQYRVVYGSGAVQTFPTSGWNTIVVADPI